MNLIRSPRFSASILLIAAALGLLVANSPFGDGFAAFRDLHLAIPGTPFDLSVGHWVSDGLLAIFFFVAAIELRYELTKGALQDRRQAIVPAVAAAGGVIVPVLIYLLIAGGADTARGWPIPTATDIAFALGVLAVFGRGLPGNVRAFLLALAILDDIVGIIFIAVLFTDDLRPMPLAIAAVLVLAFAIVSRWRPRTFTERPIWWFAMIALGLGTWAAVQLAGIHPTIAGVALGLVMAPRMADQLRENMEPFVNAIVLPVFAFFAAAVAIPTVSFSELSPAFWGVLIALPVGKVIGIGVAGWIVQKAVGSDESSRLPVGDLLAAGCLGGIGFTVSLLLGNLAFGASHELGAEVTLAVLAGSVISMIFSGIVVSMRARHYRAQATTVEA